MALDDLSADESVYVPQRPATELFRLESGVQIFFVAKDGRVSTFSEPSMLRIFRFEQQEEGEQWVPVFIQVRRMQNYPKKIDIVVGISVM